MCGTIEILPCSKTSSLDQRSFIGNDGVSMIMRAIYNLYKIKVINIGLKTKNIQKYERRTKSVLALTGMLKAILHLAYRIILEAFYTGIYIV